MCLFIGGVTAVILELAEPRIRSGVWDHTSFRTDPVTRLRRTGLAAMVQVYGPREVAEGMIAGVNHAHSAVSGVADDGQTYHADQVELLNWVQATASFGFVEAYHHYVDPLSLEDRNRFFAESGPAARLYGAMDSPKSIAEWASQLALMLPKLTPSPVIEEFLHIIRTAPALPGIGRPALQPLLVKAAIDLVPLPVRRKLGLPERPSLSAMQRSIVCKVCQISDRLMLQSSPAVQASLRLGLPADWLYR